MTGEAPTLNGGGREEVRRRNVSNREFLIVLHLSSEYVEGEYVDNFLKYNSLRFIFCYTGLFHAL